MDRRHTTYLRDFKQNFEKAQEEFKKSSYKSTIYQISPHEIFSNANEFTNQLEKFRTINFSSNNIFEADFKIQSNTIPLTPINKKFDILFNELIKFSR